MVTTVKCPTCEHAVEWTADNPYRPFCSRRCKLIDLGAWVDGSNHIPGPELQDTEADALLTRDRDDDA